MTLKALVRHAVKAWRDGGAQLVDAPQTVDTDFMCPWCGTWSADGEEVEMTANSPSAGTWYVCLSCARLLSEGGFALLTFADAERY